MQQLKRVIILGVLASSFLIGSAVAVEKGEVNAAPFSHFSKDAVNSELTETEEALLPGAGMHDEAPGKGNHPTEFGAHHIIGVCLACIGLMLAAGGGIGGGGILVPVYILVMQLSPKHGIPLSNITILGGSIANNYFNVFKRHPDPHVKRPMIDYDLVLLMEPPTIAGAVIGSILNKVLPEYVITTLLVLVLGATTIKTLGTGNKLWAKEQELKKSHGDSEEEVGCWELCCGALIDAAEGDSDEGKPLVSAETKEEMSERRGLKELTPEMEAILLEDAQMFPLWKIGAITLCFVLVVVANIVKLQYANCGTPTYWVLMMAPVVISLSMMFLVRNYLLNKGAVKAAAGADPVPGDVAWDSNTTITYPIICTLAGLFAGMFGIGGGIVKGPLMLEMGIIPEVSAATAAYMILYTASSATVTYAAFDQVKWDYAMVLFPCGILFTAIGQIVINAYIKRTNHASVIVFIIAGIVGVSTLLMGYESGITAYDDIQAGVGMGSLCVEKHHELELSRLLLL